MAEMKEALSHARAHCRAHIKECAAEITAWRRSGILKEGHVREIERILEPFVYDATHRAEAIVVEAALDIVVEMPASTTP